MRIDTDPRDPQQVDLTQIYLSFKKNYRNVFMYQLGEQAFVYRALGRKEYYELTANKEFNDFQREEILCDVCVLWPENYDWQNCDAGIPSELAKVILKNSYLDNPDSRRVVLSYYRSEMYDLDNQITCLINEAFPKYDIEQIEQWDVEKTMKYLSRAEWKLHNLHGLEFKESEGEFRDEAEARAKAQAAEEAAREKQQQSSAHDVSAASDKTIRGGSKKNKLTPEKLRELKRKFPEIDWDHDLGNEGIKGLEQPSVDVTAPALRPGWG